jgi:hypothetical protein
MEELMENARNRDSLAVSGVIYDMIAAGLTPGPRSFHALIVSYALNSDHEAAVSLLLHYHYHCLLKVSYIIKVLTPKRQQGFVEFSVV